MMGFQDCLYNLDISYASEEAIRFVDYCTEIICYNAYSASCDLAEKEENIPLMMVHYGLKVFFH